MNWREQEKVGSDESAFAIFQERDSSDLDYGRGNHPGWKKMPLKFI